MSVLSKGAERAGREEKDISETYVSQTNVKGHHKKAPEKSILINESAEKERDQRRAAPKFYVEVGPGSYKSEQVTYPPDYFKNQLKKLMLLKEKRDRYKKHEKALTASSVDGNATEIVTEAGEETTVGTEEEEET